MKAVVSEGVLQETGFYCDPVLLPRDKPIPSLGLSFPREKGQGLSSGGWEGGRVELPERVFIDERFMLIANHQPTYTVLDEDGRRWVVKWTDSVFGHAVDEYNAGVIAEELFPDHIRVPQVFAIPRSWLASQGLPDGFGDLGDLPPVMWPQTPSASFIPCVSDIAVLIRWVDTFSTEGGEEGALRRGVAKGMMGVYDKLILNCDRHSSNALFGGGVLIDNQFSLMAIERFRGRLSNERARRGCVEALVELVALSWVYFLGRDDPALAAFYREGLERVVSLDEGILSRLEERLLVPSVFWRLYRDFLQECSFALQGLFV